MKIIVLKSLAVLFLFLTQTTFSQVTLLSNNTNLEDGVPLNGKGLLLADYGDNDSLWVTNGTAAGTVRLVTNVSYVDSGSSALFNNKLFFTGASAGTGVELWATDGTAAGTTLIKDINPAGNSVPTDFVVYNNTLFFSADNGTNGLELWKTDGTTAGTVLVKDINAGTGSGLSYSASPNYTIVNGILYFNATSATEGQELWRTDGTTAGTTLVKDITAGTASTSFGLFSPLGTNLIFGVKTGSGATSTYQLWKSDGTSVGTTMLKDFGSFSGIFFTTFYLFNNKLYFNQGDFTTTGSELWVTDGTVAGTTLVKDINPGSAGSNPFLFFAVTINNKFYFQATTANEGAELWVSDGTTAGTQLLKDINPGTASSSPFVFKSIDFSGFSNTLYNGKIFLQADDGSHGTELWITDGTTAGTTLVKDIKPGAPSGLGTSTFNYFYTTAGLYFGADDGSGTEPYLSNGTSAGTSRVADVNSGTGSSNPIYLFILNNQLYFNGTNGDNTDASDLFKIDATVFYLPITLLNFSATIEPSNAVKLDWTTSTEINSSHFELERSIDGNKFSKVDEVKAAGNSTMNLNYTYLDQQAAGINTPLLYYRLKLVDKDGAFKTSSALLVHLKQSSLQFTFTPNPAQQQLNVMVSPAGAKNVALRIVDATGKLVYQQTLARGVNVYQQNINVSQLQKGAYYIQLITDNTTTTQKFIKQ